MWCMRNGERICGFITEPTWMLNHPIHHLSGSSILCSLSCSRPSSKERQGIYNFFCGFSGANPWTCQDRHIQYVLVWIYVAYSDVYGHKVTAGPINVSYTCKVGPAPLYSSVIPLPDTVGAVVILRNWYHGGNFTLILVPFPRTVPFGGRLERGIIRYI